MVDPEHLLAEVEAASPVEVVRVVADRLAALVGAGAVRFLIAGLSGRVVVHVGSAPGPLDSAETITLAGTVYERVLRTQAVDVAPVDGGARVIAPVTDRGEAIGVLELTVPEPPGERVVARIAAVAHALAVVVVAGRRHTDLFEQTQRTTNLTLAAEIQRRLLPGAYTCEAGPFTLAGWLEPAASVGGDTFDYTLDRDALQLSITDATGHEVAAALLATVLVSGLRNARRRGSDLADQARHANDALAAYSAVGLFVTGLLVRVDLTSGVALVVNAGHPFPLRLRDGGVEELELAIDRPFGIEPGRTFRLQRLQLEPGDRLVFVTDGMLERKAGRVDLAGVLARTRHQHPREVVHALGDAVLHATNGDLRDDATVLCLDWHAPRTP